MIPTNQAELDAYNARLAKLKASGTVRTHRCEGPAEADKEVLGFGHAQDARPAQPQPRQGTNVGKAVPKVVPEQSKPAEAVLRLPYPPSVNHYWLRNAGGGMRITDAGIEFRREVQLAVNRSGVIKLFGRLSVEIIASAPDKRRRDLDNVLKAILDAMQHACLYEDDSQVDDLRICRADVVKGGSLMVKVAELP